MKSNCTITVTIQMSRDDLDGLVAVLNEAVSDGHDPALADLLARLQAIRSGWDLVLNEEER